MGFDVSWHPISQKEMFHWYFDRLEEVRLGDHSRLMALAEEYRMGSDNGNEKFCAARYQEIMDTAAKVRPGSPSTRPTATSWRRSRGCSAPITTPGAGCIPT